MNLTDSSGRTNGQDHYVKNAGWDFRGLPFAAHILTEQPHWRGFLTRKCGCFPCQEKVAFIRQGVSICAKWLLRPQPMPVSVAWSDLRLVSIWSQTIVDRGSQIAKCSAIVCDHMETHFCDRLRSCDRDRRRSQTIAEDRTMLYLLRSSAIVCDRLRSIAIVRSFCDRNLSHNIFNSDPRFNSQQHSNCLFENMTGVEQGNFNNEEL